MTQKKTAHKSAKHSSSSNKSKPQKSSGKNIENLNTEKKSLNSNTFSVVSFAVSLFLIVVYCIPGGSLWGIIREKFLLGVFGIFSVLSAVLIMYVAIICAKGKLSQKGIKLQIAGWSFFILCLNSLVHIFSNETNYILYNDIFTQIKKTFNIGFSIKNGGFFGCLVGGGLTKLCTSKLAAVCVILIIIFVVLMLLTKTTLLSLSQTLKKPLNIVNERKQRRNENREGENDIFYETDGVDFTPNDLVEHDYADIPLKKQKIKPIDIEREQDISDEDIFMPSPIDLKRKAKQSNVFKPISIDREEDRYRKDTIKQTVTTDDDTIKIKKPKTEHLKKSENPFVVSDTSYISEKSGKTKIYKFPPLTCLVSGNKNGSFDYSLELKNSGQKLIETLRSFGIETRITEICRGPSVTRYEIQPAPGIKISRITGLADDIAMNMASSGIRIEAPIPNKAAVGIEIPNKNRSMVCLREIIDSDVYKNANSKLNVALGKDITGNIICADIAKMPHLLIAGTTGSGKSVCLNSMIVSILFNATPDEVKLLMIDPKQVEFTVYNSIPHLLVPVVSDPRKSAGALSWAVTEMLNRYKLFSERNVRDIKGYNKFCKAHPEMKPLPQIVIFIDELSDLMMAAPNEVEDSICRLAQMARAAGMHLVIATQRPSVDVITGLIKANIPSRISLSVSSQVDSRTIIDTAGAEKLLGNGDMLFSPVGLSKPIRVQGAYLSDEEVERVVEYIKNQSDNLYDEDIIETIENHKLNEKKKAGYDVENDEKEDVDPMLASAIEVVVDAQMASTTLLQKKLKLGYARASRIVDSLEERGIVGPFRGSKPREVLLSKQQYHEMIALSSDSNIDLRSRIDDTQEDNISENDEDDF